jgi:ABC-type lipoprotein release transport system permease subunit
MFELSVACKYLIPRWRQLSVSIISLVSMLVIALVVWLIVVFFSVKDGLENSWVDKLLALTAPIRITPTEKYYNSFYYNIDSISSQANFTHKTIGEKLAAEQTDPYDPINDEEPPAYWAKPQLNHQGKLQDLVKEAYQTIITSPEFQKPSITEYEATAALLKLRMLRPYNEIDQEHPKGTLTQQFIEQAAYIGSFNPKTPAIAKILLPLTPSDHQNLQQLQSTNPKLKPSSPIPIAKIADDGIGIILPSDEHYGEAILVPRSYKDAGVLAGDRGYISYYSPTPSAVQEQRIPVYVAGFYDPGIISIGGKFILASQQLTGLIRASHNQEDTLQSNGFNVHFKNIADAHKIKTALVKTFKEQGLDAYWNIETYQEYDFTKDLIQQLHSEKNLFSLISMVIIIVACSNIISMLIILVNDKKMEIGILRSMGATSGSIAAIFGLCGMVMGAFGSIIGIVLALITLNNLKFLVDTISRFQGYDLFNPVFYGNTLPNQISMVVRGYVFLATACISLLSGIVPAVKASLLRPSSILRSE